MLAHKISVTEQIHTCTSDYKKYELAIYVSWAYLYNDLRNNRSKTNKSTTPQCLVRVELFIYILSKTFISINVSQTLTKMLISKK